jgi:hypothetical protein
MENAWLIVKRDLYYMPNGMGYTGVRDHAGRYSYEEARQHVRDPEDGVAVTMIRLADAPEFSKGCWDDLARKHLQKQRDAMRDALARVVQLIDAAGLHNLSNGVQLGPTSWFVKMSDAMAAAKELLPPATSEH